ncbi:MAG: hypothetical protein KDA58_08155 [Planctomycetaceae bacterium]|nr:hypothetical protein [Planctomycetaceae bacterium]
MPLSTQIGLLIIFLSTTGHLAAANEEETDWEFAPGQSEQFASAECQIRILSRRDKLPTRILWTLQTESRTLSKDSSRLEPVPDIAGIWTFSIRTPQLKPGITFHVDLTCSLPDAGDEQTLTITLRDPNPFASLQETLRTRGIALLDTEGSTWEALDALEIPVHRIKSLDMLKDQQLLILGEGIEWSNRLQSQLSDLRQQPRSILALRPATDARWPVEWFGGQGREWRLLHLTESNVTPEKLNTAVLMNPTEKVGWRLQVEDGKVWLAPGTGEETWTMSEFHRSTGGRELFVGVPLIKYWNISPVPRELLSHWMISLTEKPAAVEAAQTK